MLTALRQTLTQRMAALEPQRRPALRRADDDAWLLCTDLPALIDGPRLAALTHSLEAEGWRCAQVRGWLYLDHPLPVPQITDAHLTGEAACAASLLRRHPYPVQDDVFLRRLVKAQEQGPAKVEAVCRSLHAECAARLRRHQPLPGLLLPYLIQAAKLKEVSP